MPEQLGRLAALVDGALHGADLLITDVTHDSRHVRAGSLFVAIEGASFDGHTFVPSLPPGSAACVRHLVGEGEPPQLLVADTRAVLGPLAHNVHGRPSEALTVIGVTGTNGKTSVTYLLEGILTVAGRRPAIVGTTGVVVSGEHRPLQRTTPEASSLHRLLAELLEAGVDTVAMEVSSHALAFGRVEGVEFDVVGFTNLSHDHLDFHADMDDYFETKASLFERCATAVINVADPHGRKLADRYPALEVGVDVRASDVGATIDSTSFTLHVGEAMVGVTMPLGGVFTLENSLVAAGIASRLGIDIDTIARGLERPPTIPGRFEAIRAGQGFGVVVDYAHSPDGVAVAVASAKAVTSGRTIAVLGAGGDRDVAKRRPMGSAAAAADVVILTSDNPRSEDPLAIIEDLRAGTEGLGAEIRVDPDRTRAIRAALALAEPGDTVVILGKGHEATQDVGGRTIPFDDRVVARSALEELLR